MAIWFDTITITAGATALALSDRVTDSSLANPFVLNGAQVVSLNFIGNKDMRVGGTATACNETHGGVLAAERVFSDSVSGGSSNTLPLSQFFLYAPLEDGDITVTVYIRTAG